MRYANFDLLIIPSAKGYTAHVIDSLAGEATVTNHRPARANFQIVRRQKPIRPKSH